MASGKTARKMAVAFTLITPKDTGSNALGKMTS
jgi:hypothetical protein